MVEGDGRGGGGVGAAKLLLRRHLRRPCVRSPGPDGLRYPGAGATIGALENVTNKTADATIGKPGPMLLDILFETQGLDKRRAIMVGDRLDTDIEFGRRGGVDTLLVLTGVTPRQIADKAAGDQVATYGLQSLGLVGSALQYFKKR